MTYKTTSALMDSARDARNGAARGGPARLALTVLATTGVLGLAACQSPASSPATATTPASTPSGVSSASTPAAAPSTPASSDSASQSTTPPAGAGVTATAANAADLSQFTAAASGKCGFTTSADTLANAKVTNTGWGSATVTAKNPEDQGNESMVFRLGRNWTMDQCGSDFTGSNIPQNVLEALGL
jgi:hypothetical protein